MKTKFNGILTLILALLVHVSYAQDKTISGKVTDGSEPLPGVSVIKKGTKIGTETDFDGKYVIKAKTGDVLVFSFVGMKSIEKVVGSGSTVNAILSEDSSVLDEVVVTGVATGTSRKKLGVSVSSVNAEKLADLGTPSVEQALQGKVAGAIIQSNSGQPGQQQDIVLRSIASLQGTNPLVLIDGLAVDTGSSSIGGASNLSSRLADIDFSNVARVEVVTGASGATIYGAQGANGVINIITKKGKSGAPRVTLNTSVGFSNVISNEDARRTRLHRYQTDTNGFLVDGTGTRVTQLNAESQFLPVAINIVDVNGTQLGAEGINNIPYAEQTFDAVDELFNTAFNTTYGATVSGGSENITYLASGSRTENESVLINGDYVRYNSRLKLGIKLSDKLNFDTRIDYISSRNTTGTDTDAAADNNLINGVYQNLPHVNLNVRNSDGDLVVAPDATDPNSTNPFFFRDAQVRQDEISRTITNFTLNYDPFDFLNVNLKYGFDTYSQTFNFFQNREDDHQQADQITNNSGILTETNTNFFFQNLLANANLKFELKEGLPLESTTSITFDWRDEEASSTSVQGTDNPFTGFGSFTINQSKTKTLNSIGNATFVPFRTYGILVNQKLDFYDGLFGIGGGFRSDVSSRFGNDVTGTFGRFNGYFNIADVIESDPLQQLKIRAAWGQAGIQPPFGSNLEAFDVVTIGNEAPIFSQTTIGNTSLAPAVNTELEVGLDYSIKTNNKNWFTNLRGSVNYFTNETEGAISIAELAPSTGAPQIRTNAYDLSSDGFDFSLDLGVYESDNFSWNFGTRFTKSTTVLDRIANGQALVVGDFFTLEEGQEIGSFSVFDIVRSIDQEDSQGNLIIPAADANNFTVASTGYVVNKNTGKPVFTQEKTAGGSTQPDFVMSFFNDFKINKFFEISTQVDWFQGMDVYNRAKQWLYNNGLHQETSVPVTIEDPSGVDRTGAFVSYYTGLYNTNVPTSHFIEDASFIRLRNVSFKFKLNDLVKFKNVQDITLTLSGRNLVTITDYTGLDPEAARNFGNPFQRGFDEFTHPNTKSYNLGLKVTF
ncbi:SusC/RagA family TonB-linked outer membrane protein [Tenacibaculum jejuense]|uniref:SusC-like TonB-dependent outer membrane receptor n=1 Tax=Tenacibaculum jejuense TaxID=584609 RepID=A0A238UF35_9FLAO|nr:SusC/RagA family TonB-linked outer membrane protein [Tenacibaculum jejuense]SNR17084.1 SusC-like TonB-dependent outer membrane receptor precursor [Tenacibaculum jejuense]